MRNGLCRERRKGLWERLMEQGLFEQTENRESGMRRLQEVCSRLKELRPYGCWKGCRFKEAKEAWSVADKGSVQKHEMTLF